MENRAIELIANVFLYEKLPVLHNVFWTKNGEKLDTQGSGGRYNGMTTTEPSLTIFDVSEHDAGSYQLTATNLVGATTSDVIVLGKSICIFILLKNSFYIKRIFFFFK